MWNKIQRVCIAIFAGVVVYLAMNWARVFMYYNQKEVLKSISLPHTIVAGVIGATCMAMIVLARKKMNEKE
ncbi:MAG: hypothetical protein K6A30_01150 [Lachnospiraceae bacterium]|nr:hypothetical protein [Lachnospiraceae bacterium]